MNLSDKNYPGHNRLGAVANPEVQTGGKKGTALKGDGISVCLGHSGDGWSELLVINRNQVWRTQIALSLRMRNLGRFSS